MWFLVVFWIPELFNLVPVFGERNLWAPQNGCISLSLFSWDDLKDCVGYIGRLLAVTMRIKKTRRDTKLQPCIMISETGLKWLFCEKTCTGVIYVKTKFFYSVQFFHIQYKFVSVSLARHYVSWIETKWCEKMNCWRCCTSQAASFDHELRSQCVPQAKLCSEHPYKYMRTKFCSVFVQEEGHK